MDYKLLVIGFFLLGWYVRTFWVWEWFDDRDNSKICPITDGVAPNLPLWDCLRTLSLGVLCYFYLNTPVQQASLTVWAVVVYLLGWVMGAVGRLHLGFSWSNSLHATVEYKPLVMSGIYSLSRNPIYLGRMIEWVGFALVIANDFVYGQSIVVEPYALFYLAHLGILVNSIVMHHWCIRAEEKFLSARHGLNYVRYTQTVPRYVSLPALARQLTDSLTTST